MAAIGETPKIPPLDQEQVNYSERYPDGKYEYRHVTLPKEFAKYVPRTHLMTETEWRNLGVQQSVGWQHYMIHAPEPHILLFRRPLDSNAIPTHSQRVAGTADATMDSFNISETYSKADDSTVDENCPESFDISFQNARLELEDSFQNKK